ncbi:MAG: class I SAM-dependent methyltransferase [Candidatus Bathyarchaeota archaeon]|nr:class I SAM-dependent methyltransferase [Candidatus Bathyarchaeum sp.]
MGLINWQELWEIKLQSAHRTELNTVDFWDKRAKGFNENMSQMQNLTKNQLERIQLKPEYTVLDVGAGAGRLTIPIAKRVKHVTAIEPSVNMFSILKSNTTKENLQNITALNRSCEDLLLEDAVQPHDVVVASFSLFMVNIAHVLEKMDTLANKTVYIFVSASTWMHDELQKIVNGDVSPIKSSDYIYVYNILHDLGILANVDIWSSDSTHCYHNLDDATSKFGEMYNIAANKKADLRAYLNKHLVKEDKKLCLKHERKTAMIWWTKT